MANNDGNETSTPDKPEVNPVLIEQRRRYRTPYTYKPYADPYLDAIWDIYITLLGDIKIMKAADPIPREVLAEAEEELNGLKKELKRAGMEFND
jgi:hypothetical protein